MSRLRAGATWKLKIFKKHEKLFTLRVDFRDCEGVAIIYVKGQIDLGG